MAQEINKTRIYVMTYNGYNAKARPFTKEILLSYLKTHSLGGLNFVSE